MIRLRNRTPSTVFERCAGRSAAVLAAALAFTSLVEAQDAPRDAPQDLDALLGLHGGSVRVSTTGVLVGTKLGPDGGFSVSRAGRAPVEVASPEAAAPAVPWEVNAGGVVAGTLGTNGTTGVTRSADGRANGQLFRWSEATGFERLALPQAFERVRPVGLDDSGRLVVNVEYLVGGRFRIARIGPDADALEELPCPNAAPCEARATNGAGDVVGTAGVATLWSAGGAVTPLAVPTTATVVGPGCVPMAINARGTIVGACYENRASKLEPLVVVWSGPAHTPRILGAGTPTSINDDDVVGGAVPVRGDLGTSWRAQLWDLGRGDRAVLLPPFVHPDGLEQESNVLGIDDAGIAVGVSLSESGVQRAVRYTQYAPVD